MTQRRQRLGQLLVDARIISQEQLEHALQLQAKEGGRRLGVILVEAGLLNETQLTQILSQQLNAPWVSLYHIDFSRQLLNLVPRDVAEEFCLVPIYVRHVRGQGETLYVAMEDPTNEHALKACAMSSSLPARAMIAPPSDIRNAIRVYYGGGEPESAGDAQPASLPPEMIHQAEPEAASEPPPATLQAPTSYPNEGDLSPAGAIESQVEPPQAFPAETPPTPPSPSAREQHVSEPYIELSMEDELDEEIVVTAATPIPADVAPTEAKPKPITQPAPAAPAAEASARPAPKAKSSKGSGKMIALTLLDGTTITLPAKNKGDGRGGRRVTGAKGERGEDVELTARDMVAALRAVSHGADASEILGDDLRWEKVFAALLSVLLRKHLIADWEFVEEFKKILCSHLSS